VFNIFSSPQVLADRSVTGGGGDFVVFGAFVVVLGAFVVSSGSAAGAPVIGTRVGAGDGAGVGTEVL
jgi:hypothetical protein